MITRPSDCLMLVTFAPPFVGYVPPLTIAITDDQACAVIAIMRSAGWQLVGKVYHPTTAHIEAFQAVVLEQCGCAAETSLRPALEFAVSLATASALPGLTITPPSASLH
jgi:hypothetical protein